MCNHHEESEYIWEHGVLLGSHPVWLSSQTNLKLLYNPVEEQFIVCHYITEGKDTVQFNLLFTSLCAGIVLYYFLALIISFYLSVVLIILKDCICSVSKTEEFMDTIINLKLKFSRDQRDFSLSSNTMELDCLLSCVAQIGNKMSLS